MQFTGGLTFANGVTLTPPAGGGGLSANIKLLLPMNGANNSTTFTDYSSTGRTVTAYGDAKISTAQSKWGGSSAYFDGTGDYLSVPYDPAIIQWFEQDFTIECWINVVDLATMSTYPVYASLIGQGNPDSGAPFWSFGPLDDGRVIMYWSNAGVRYKVSTQTITANTWNHIAMVKSGSGVEIYVNGIGTGAPVSFPATYSNSLPLIIGKLYNRAINAYVNDMRITHSAVYTSNFSVPTAAFPTS
jgi:hypothetical protein